MRNWYFYLKFIVGLLSTYSIHFLLDVIYYFDNFQIVSNCNFDPSTIYDYIVVGSGTAGGLVSYRLSESKSLKILILEAGTFHNSFVFDIPPFGLMLQKSVYDWQYKTVPQTNACWGLKNNQSHWPRGKIVGGSGKLNNMIYVRGHPDDYRTWFDPNPKKYNYTSQIQPYFERIEQFFDLNQIPYVSDLSKRILHRVKYLSDFSNFHIAQLTIKNQRRWTSSDLIPYTNRNIDLCTKCHVENVNLTHDGYVNSVKFWRDGVAHIAQTRYGVVLSAGAINTPQILMLSGIGESAHLIQHGIPVRVALDGVGDNLQDHLTTGLDLVHSTNGAEGFSILDLVAPHTICDYFSGKGGKWLSGGCDVGGFLGNGTTQPQIQFMVAPVGTNSDSGAWLRYLSGITDTIWYKYFTHLPQNSISILPVLLHPNSYGTIRLKNSNFRTAPLIQPNYLHDPNDLNTLVHGLEAVVRLISTIPNIELNRLPLPVCKHEKFATKPYWECYVRHLTYTVYHPVGTCRLGTVLDYDFRVKGTRNLYVVDASVLPNLPSGNPVSTILMVAEKASERILQLQQQYFHPFQSSQSQCKATESIF